MKTFYAVHLNKSFSGLSRWALYYRKGPDLVPCWQIQNLKSVSPESKPLPHQVYYPVSFAFKETYPAYHFVVKGYGLNHLDTLASSLAEHFNQAVQVFPSDGWNSSPRTAPKPKSAAQIKSEKSK